MTPHAAASLGLFLLGCAASAVAPRPAGAGRGRAVAPEALAAYARARHADARGEAPVALAEYARVLELDPECSEAWTRIGALRCNRDPAGSRAAFARAEAHARDPATVFRARAACELMQGRADAARASAWHAVELDPETSEGALLYARVLSAQGDREGARRWLQALVLRSPAERQAWLALAEVAREGGDVAGARLAERGAVRAGAVLSQERRAELAAVEVDRQLLGRDLPGARAAAVPAGLSESRLALRALALGRPELALEAATLAYGADPTDTEAWIASVVAASLVADRGELERVAAELPADALMPGSLALALYAELLSREVGPAAAAAWIDGCPALEPAGDAPERAVIERVLRERDGARATAATGSP